MVVVVGPVFPYRGGIADTNTIFIQTLLEQGEVVESVSFSTLYPKILFPGKSQFSEENNSFSSRRLISTINPITWWKTAAYIRSLQPKVVVFRYWTPWLAPCYRVIASKLPCKKVAWIDNALPHERKATDKTLFTLFLKGVHKIFCMSEQVAKEVKKYTSKPVTSFYHPINNFLPKPISKAEAKRVLGLDDSLQYLLFFGLIRPYKGLDMLITCLPEVKKHHPNVRVLVVGEAYESLMKYKKLVTSLQVEELVLFNNNYVSVAETANWFSACDWVVQPYTSASQSGITPMAIHFSRPSIVTDVGGLSEGITAHTGIVSKPTPKELAKTISTAISQSQAFGNEDRFQEIREQNSWHRFCQLFTISYIQN